jgi:hypothetical protein
MKRLKRINWKGLIAAILTIGAVVGIVGGIAVGLSKDTKTLSKGIFEVGALDSKGGHVKADDKLYTPDLFECRGMVIEPDFEFDGTYSVYLYNRNKELLNVYENQTATFRVSDELVCYARVMITPVAPTDKEDFKIKFWNKRSYASVLDITVLKDQSAKFLNLFDAETGEVGYVMSGKAVDNYDPENPQTCTKVKYDTLSWYDEEYEWSYVEVDVKDIDEVTFVYENGTTSNGSTYYFCTDEHGNILFATSQPIGLTELIVSVPEGATVLYANYCIGNEFAIYQTK